VKQTLSDFRQGIHYLSIACPGENDTEDKVMTTPCLASRGSDNSPDQCENPVPLFKGSHVELATALSSDA
jgi:hypothetical protein